MKRKIAFFDFDDTLLPQDSMKRLIYFCLKRHPWSFIYLFKLAFLGLLYGIKVISFIPLKQAILFPLNHLSEKELELFYQECLIPHYYTNVVEELKQKKSEGYLIYLVSASPEVYLKYTDLPVDMVIGTKTLTKEGKNTSKVIGKNCKGEEKVRRIQEILKKQNIEIDYDHSYGYSDSLTDMPMLMLVKHRIRINKKDGSMSQFE
ncbi:HAD family hydrolase [Beduini massiliensis]|uniref:HAD family hydrolase n=1 Tax=Beduini massiliensis TaxID=1585974 RepID=UPI00059AA52A|nr:HAD family hydrolase [Beduini massiliensis]